MLHIITPFSRIQYKDFYMSNLRNKEIIWHPIVTNTKIFIEKEDWLQPCIFEDMDLSNNTFNPNVIKINKFIKTFKIIDDDVYCFFNDDDWVEEDFFKSIESIETHFNIDVFFISMKRGHQIPVDANIPHGTSTLFARKGVGIGSIGFEQIFVKGYVLKQMEFLSDIKNERAHCPDGAMAEWLQENFGILYVPEIFSYFNYLEKGRWNKL